VRASIEVQPMHGLTDGQVEQMLHASFEHAKEDFDQSRLANLRVELGTMIRAVETNLGGALEQLDRESVAELREALVRAQQVRESDQLEAVQQARDELERASMPLAAALMDSVAKQALSGKTLDEV
jgi:molecular chaperone DnaK (HSP70)